jgi:ADP-heptose:LPS heptosyltransferase
VSAADGAPVLVARLDNAGDVLLAGPAIRAVARTSPVVLAVGPLGRAAAELLPGVREVLDLTAPWILGKPPPVDGAALDRFVADVARVGPRAAAVLTSSHQSPLPLALLLRLAGVAEIAGISHDYPGSLLDHRIPGDPDVHEVARALAVVARLGYEPAPGDDRLALAVGPDPPPALAARLPAAPYVVVHPGASVPARTLRPDQWAAAVAALAAAGHRVVVTGSAAERHLTAAVAAGTGPAAAPRLGVTDLGGAGDLAGLAAVLAGAAVVVCGNTGPAHLAAAVGTPVAVAFAATVPLDRWRPWRVPHVALGRQNVPCAGCRARICPIAGQPCLAEVTPADVVTAVEHLAGHPGPAELPRTGGPIPTLLTTHVGSVTTQEEVR